MLKNNFIVIEGLDGSGKATQSKMLVEFMNSYPNIACSASYITFPNYDNKSSDLVKMYLNGELGDNPYGVNAFAASTFYAMDRYISYLNDWKTKFSEGSIIADRYTTSNAIYQCAKLPRREWDNFTDWLFDYEYNKLGLPEPNTVIYLYVPIKVSQRLMSERYSGDESKKDIHEKNLKYLADCQKAAKYCSEKYNWTVIDCTDGKGNMLSIAAIHELIKKATFGLSIPTCR